MLQTPIYFYEKARSLGYFSEGILLDLASRWVPTGQPVTWKADRELIKVVNGHADQLFKRDAELFESGLYPLSTLIPENPRDHLLRVPQLLGKAVLSNLRRARKSTKQFSRRAKEELDFVPTYFRRNYHFQDDGYLSENSARLYDHQVELLFRGTGDAMRRLILRALKDQFSGDGEGLTFLEVAAGAGSTTRFVREAFPKARIVVTDMSEPYLNVAREKLAKKPKVDFVRADAANLPFKEDMFDAVYSVFLYHEVPADVRPKIVSEGTRVLKTGGVFAFVDSCQRGDNKDLDVLLEQFPSQFHEPFYKSYFENPMEPVMTAEGYQNFKTEMGFLSKALWAVKQ